ncbi:hypothetical protein AX16_007555 [Volvariella volvacea WC 439]|nr:hypothetical protein AX16_007555 [Volvariella volvacea WC 439]
MNGSASTHSKHDQLNQHHLGGKVKLRYVRPSDTASVLRLVRYGLIYGPDSPCNLAMQRQPFERKSYLAYLLIGLGVFVGTSPSSVERFWHQCISLGISLGIRPSLGSKLKWLSTPNSTSSLFQTLRTNWSLRFISTIRLWGILLSLSSAIAFLWYRRYMRKLFDRFAVLFISVDMGNIVEYYGMKEVVVVDEKGEKKSDWTPAGQSGFWVVEPVGGQDAGEILSETATSQRAKFVGW